MKVNNLRCFRFVVFVQRLLTTSKHLPMHT